MLLFVRQVDYKPIKSFAQNQSVPKYSFWDRFWDLRKEVLCKELTEL
jgi:hypothetical protein